MERRLGGRTSSTLDLTGPAIALALATALILATGPGAAASRAPAQLHNLRAPAAADGELADLAWDLEYDIEKILRFVAEEIRYEPYPGILRGARGTLDARAGNSVDQSLLLAAFLDESAVPYRFARGPLDEAMSAELIDSIATDSADARRIVETALTRGLDEFAGSDATGPEPSGPLADLNEEQAREVAADTESRLSETVTMIETALDEAGIDLPAVGVSLPPAEVADHTWVQVPHGADWLDLDPTLASSEPGTVLTQALETLDRLPDDLRHRVGFEVLVERVAGGRLVTDAVLEYTAFADEIAGVPVTFGHITPSGAERLGVSLRNVFGDGRIDYRATLDIGRGSLVADEPVAFGLAGTEGGGGLFEGTDLFTDEASPTDHAGPAEGEATAEWLTVRVTGPGSEPAVARRTVFDRLPPHLRHGGEATLEAVEPIELIDSDGSGSTDFPPMLGVEAFAVATGPTSVATILAKLPDEELGTVALAYHSLRDAMGAGIAIDAGARTFVDGPNIVSFSLDIDEPAEVRNVRVGLDIWHRDHGILPLTGLSTTAAGAELVAGITGHIAERVALEGLADAPGVDQRAIGVGRLFEAAATQGIPIRVLQGSESGSLPYGPMATQLLQEALASGDVVVIPAEPVMVGDTERVGWWKIDPATGVTNDVMDDGSGQEVVEYATLSTGRVRQFVCFGAMANWAAGSIIASAALFTTLSGSAMFRLFNASPWQGTRCFGL